MLPYGHQHKMGGAADTSCVSVMELMSPPPWTQLPVIRHGAGGTRTDVICGYLDVDDPLFDPGGVQPCVQARQRSVTRSLAGARNRDDRRRRLRRSDHPPGSPDDQPARHWR